MHQPIRSKFISHSTTVCADICFEWPSGKGLAFLSRLIGMPSWCRIATSRSVLDCLPYCSCLYLTLQTDLFFPSLLHTFSPSKTSVGGTFCTKGGAVCTRAKCPGGHCALGQDVWRDILPSDTRIRALFRAEIKTKEQKGRVYSLALTLTPTLTLYHLSASYSSWTSALYRLMCANTHKAYSYFGPE